MLLALSSLQCAELPPASPHTPAQYQQMQAKNPDAYTRRTVILSNTQRVLDADLPTPDRVGSMQLLAHVGISDPSIIAKLSAATNKPDCPQELRDEMVAFLMGEKHPIAPTAVASVPSPLHPVPSPLHPVPSPLHPEPTPPRTKSAPRLTKKILNPSGAGKKSTPKTLSQLVRLWADQPVTGPDEPAYRHIAEQLTARHWDDALLAAINSPAKFERGRAMEILAARLPTHRLKLRILELQPRTEAIAALQSFLDNFSYVPMTRAELAAVVAIFKTRLSSMRDAARLSNRWVSEYGYAFTIRDFHLLNKLSRDPLRNMISRTRLITQLSQIFDVRRHVPYSDRVLDRAKISTDEFSIQAEILSMSDLWKLHLLDEMLSRPRMLLALKIMADENRSKSAPGDPGLVFYKQGQADAMLYPGASSGQLVRDGRDSLCRFSTNFARKDNSLEVGPSQTQLTDARKGNYCGLVLTSVNPQTFTAYYYNAQGKIVSMGNYPFRN